MIGVGLKSGSLTRIKIAPSYPPPLKYPINEIIWTKLFHLHGIFKKKMKSEERSPPPTHTHSLKDWFGPCSEKIGPIYSCMP